MTIAPLKIPPRDSAAGEALEANAEAAQRLAREVERAEKRLNGRLETDPATGKQVLTSDDMKFLIDFNERVKRETGCNFIDFQSLFAACAKEAREAMNAARAIKE